MAQGRLEFDAGSLHAACEREGLVGNSEPAPMVFGVKSFTHPIDTLEDRCSKVLNLVGYFEERHIRSEADWQTNLYPALSAFLLDAANGRDRVRLALDAHVT